MPRLHVPTGLRWSDLDAYGHVNNVAVARILEEARIVVFWADPDAVDSGSGTAVLDALHGSETQSVLARQEIEYLQPIPYLRRPLDVQLWFAHIGGASMELFYEIHSPAGSEEDVLFVRASTTLVLVDASTGRPIRISDEARAAWSGFMDEPIAFRRRF
ncbi:acyl-CoA thioesterase [Cnuibacter sp. UC19_7]|uniref:acyl-CoA thioesterase n=1 Tax=Cnuibacter sp. UC19_7 TaxID=3350166 RepID=UPI003672C4C3